MDSGWNVALHLINIIETYYSGKSSNTNFFRFLFGCYNISSYICSVKVSIIKRMYKEIDLNDQSLFESNLSSVAPKDNMTLEEAYEYVMDKVRAVYEMKDAV